MDYNIEKIYQDMELHLIASMRRNLSRHLKEEAKEGFQWSQWQAEKLKELKKYQRENKKIINFYTKKIPDDVSKLMQLQFKEGSRKAQKEYKKFNKNYKYNQRVQSSFFGINTRKVNNLIKSTVSDLSVANHATLRMINDEYRQVIHKVSMFAGNGVMTEKQAIDMATKDFLDRGITSIEYKDGSRHNIASYSKMAVRTAEQRAMLQGEGEFRKKIGNPLVQISRHGTACKICQEWEGKILIDDVYSGGSLKDGQYPLLSIAMKEGLYHPNCRHGLSTYYSELENVKFTDDGPSKTTLQQYNKNINDCNFMIQKFLRLEKGSLDEKNISYYRIKKKQWIQKKQLIETNLHNSKDVLEYKKRINFSLSGIESDYQEEIKNAVFLINQKYPIYADFSVKTTTNKKVFGQQQTIVDLVKVRNKDLYKAVLKNEIMINKDYMKSKKMSDTLHMNNYKIRKSKLNDSLATVYHEYGHLIDKMYTIKNTDGLSEKMNSLIRHYNENEAIKIVEQINDINTEINTGINRLSYVMWEKMKKKMNIGNDVTFIQLVNNELGKYATKSKGEFFAEGIANMMTLKKKSKFLELFEETFNIEYTDKFGGGANGSIK